MKALVFENRVVDLVDTEFEVHSNFTWMDSPIGCKTGWLLEDGVLIAPPEPPELTYAEKRFREYPSIGDQLDMQYHDQIDGTTTWQDAIAKVKADNPKPE